MTTNPCLPDSLKWYQEEPLRIERRIKELPINSEEFSQACIELSEALKALSKAYTRHANSLAQIGSSVALAVQVVRSLSPPRPPSISNVGFDFANVNRWKLPRKKKKAFIKQYGRTAYYHRYYDPQIVLMLDSPGGMIG